MASNLVELVNEYYEARKPYTQMLREAHASLPTKHSSPKTDTSTAEAIDMVQSQQESPFSTSPRIPNEEMRDVLKRLEATKIEYAQGDKSTGKASAERKGKAPVEKK
ncbi:hypothetical protein HO173_005080 [Letharia columbiana]|uniref:Uncharacterized protein n=1 Tax=Letharia columbiana TaxID=112416 RepID=A0A8H6FXV1_9LECA|nr:uncharacterized protein HO173_005080 [Letharia columbiana]KAF6236789.1 hypothetical protein HO173_005080 [Letharia columbiana]